MSSIRQSASSSTLSFSSTNSNSSNTSRSSSNAAHPAAHPASEPTPQYPPPVHRRSKSAEKDTSISTTPNSSLSSYSPSSFPNRHHHKDASSTSQLSANEPLIHPVKANNKKSNRGCMAQFDFTYTGLYVSGSQYGRKTLGTGTGAGGSGECVIM